MSTKFNEVNSNYDLQNNNQQTIKNQNQEQKAQTISSSEEPTIISQNFLFDGYNMPRIPCLYHKGNILTNFCSCIDCLLPLCPQCVEEHIVKHRSLGVQNKIESLESVLNECYQQITKEANDFARSFLDLQKNVNNMEVSTDKTIFKIEDIRKRTIKIIDQFFNSIKNEVENKQRKNKENQQRDAKLLQALVQERWSSLIVFIENLNSEQSMSSVIQYYGTTLLDDNATYFEVLDKYQNRFEQVTSDVIFLQERSIEIAQHMSQLIKIRHQDVHEFVDIHSLPNPHIKDSQSLQRKNLSRIPPSKPQYPALYNQQFIPPQKVYTGSNRILEDGTYYNEKHYTDQLNQLPQYQLRR